MEFDDEEFNNILYNSNINKPTSVLNNEDLYNINNISNNLSNFLLSLQNLNHDTAIISYNNTDIQNISQIRDELTNFIRNLQQNNFINENNNNNFIGINQVGGSLDISKFMKIVQVRDQYISKFKYTGKMFKVMFENLPPDFHQLNNIIYKCVEKILNLGFSTAKKNDRIRLVIEHPTLETPISFPYMLPAELTTELVLTTIAQISQSKKSVKFDENMTILTSIVNFPVGSGSNSLTKYVNRKRSIIKIINDDKLCALRAILVGAALAEKKNDPTNEDKKKYYIKMYRPNSKTQTKETKKLAKAIHVKQGPCGLDEIKKAEIYLENYQIYVFGDEKNLFKYLYKGVEEKAKKIFLLLRENHFDVLTSVPAFFSTRNFCVTCGKHYQSAFYQHPCNDVCKVCEQRECLKDDSNIKCNWCKVKCRNRNCLSYHQIMKCGLQQKCSTCGRFMYRNHVCGGRYCINCKINVDKEHECFILTDAEKQKILNDKDNYKDKNNKKQFLEPKATGYIFFDYECMIEDQHVPNLIIANKMCIYCVENWKNKDTANQCISFCGIQKFYSNNEFCEWLFEQKDYISMAHNLSYDGFFIMQYIIENLLPNELDVNCLINGGKLLCIYHRDVKIIDSYNFIPLALAKCPKTFGLTELHKGYFPYLFNTKSNQQVKNVAYPSPEFYGDKYMQSKARDDFLKWHSQQNDKNFNLQEELVKYCLSDVDILTKSCLTYRDIFMEATKSDKIENDCGIDPFMKCLTIASVCNFIYRRNFMPEKSIAIIPEYGLNLGRNHSHKQLLWLKYISVKDNIYIRHCKNGGEMKIGNYYLDGYDELSETGYEFHGCIFHGCPKCQKPTTFNTIKQETMASIYKQHLDRIRYINLHVKNLIEIWECDWDKLVKNNNELKEFIKNEDDIRPDLKPRDALFGGRTNAATLYYKAKENEKIKYYDFTSVYPCVMKICAFPIGFPTVITENFDANFSNYFGLVYCRILPPKKLLFPVLPTRYDHKLLFVLCNECAKIKQRNCTHNEKERSIEGTWITEEVKHALKRGYKILKIFSIWHFTENEIYNKETKTGGLFTDYVNKFLKMKTEATGFPDRLKTTLEKQTFINDYYDHEGILLDIENMKPNPGMKAISKLFLNSLWGRFGLNSNKTQHKLINDVSQLYELFLNEQYVVNDVNFLNENIAQAFYSKNDDMHAGTNDTNVVIASFVTCYARLKLLDLLEKLDDRVLYFDTDSCIFISKEGLWEPELGDYLGDLTNEIEGSHSNHIVEGIFPGPKNYSYKTDVGDTVCKVKGFSLNYTAEQNVNFETMKEMILNKIIDNDENEPIRINVEQSVITRNRKTWTICSGIISKVYSHVYDKRVLNNDFTTLPYGYISK